MEDVKKYLAIAARHSFWILTGLVLIVSSVFFYLTKANLDQTIDTRKSSLKSTFDKIQSVEGKVGTHPNESSHKEMQGLLTGLKDDVEKAWEFQYKRQEEFLTWPTEAFINPKTHKIFESLRPFESIVPFPIPSPAPPPLDLITRNDRSVYKKYIAPEFPDLARRIGSTWKYTLDPTLSAPKTGSTAGKNAGGLGGFSGSDGGGGAANEVVDTRDLVRWSESSQEALASSVLPWFDRAEPPDIHEIYYAQEDIWILRGLMDIIAKTNAGANENFQAIVKEIEWIVTGPRAFRDAGSLWNSEQLGMGGTSGSQAGSGASGSAMGNFGSGAPSFKGPAGEGSGMQTDAGIRVDPANGRYVDANLQPLSGTQLRGAIKEINPNAVAKRVQVRMRLKVDERFGRLITECGNGKMMLEVLQVRYNTASAISLGGSGFSGGGGGGFGSKKGLMSGGMGGAPGDDEPSPRQNTETQTAASGEVSIEIYGLIYLFNPPPSLSKTLAAATGEPSPNPANNGVAGAASNPKDQKPNTPASEPVTTPEPSATPAPPADNTPAEPPANDSASGEPQPSAETPSEEVESNEPPPADNTANDGGGS